MNNVALLSPEALSGINRLVVETGHAVSKKAWRAVGRAV